MKKEVVFVGLSGGVDSSVAALRLKKAGHTVVGVFIKVWQPDFLECNWEQERLDAMRVAAHLDIPFLTFDAEETYKREVADYMIREYKEGRTPNPDVMCNQHVKFGAFLEFAKAQGADKVATGHYARMVKHGDEHLLLRGVDTDKDQSYFLWTLTEYQRKHIYFPVGDTSKAQVRKEAEAAELLTFKKPDSQGICFLGHVDIQEFLSHYITLTPGRVLDTKGAVIGTHNGALLYTLGQRHGFTVHTKSKSQHAQYVVAKDLTHNTITIASEPPRRVEQRIPLVHVNQIIPFPDEPVAAQFRYRQAPFRVNVTSTAGSVFVTPEGAVETPSAGQSCVLYDGDICLGGGVISM